MSDLLITAGWWLLGAGLCALLVAVLRDSTEGAIPRYLHACRYHHSDTGQHGRERHRGHLPVRSGDRARPGLPIRCEDRMITPDQLDSWRRLAACDALAGAPGGDALEAACDEIVDLECRLTQATAPGKTALAALVTAEADRDRARDAAVALEQENARIRAYAERCARSGSHAYAKAGRELLEILDGGERS